MSGYYQKEINFKTGASLVVGASETALPISKEFVMSYEGAQFLKVIVVADSVTAGAGITWTMQQWLGLDEDGNDEWAACGAPKTVSITADGVTTMTWNNNLAADAAYLPFTNKARIVITTGVGSAVTIERVSVLQRD